MTGDKASCSASVSPQAKGAGTLNFESQKQFPAIWFEKWKSLRKKNAGKMYSVSWKQSVRKLLSCSVSEERERIANTGQIHQRDQLFGGRLSALPWLFYLQMMHILQRNLQCRQSQIPEAGFTAALDTQLTAHPPSRYPSHAGVWDGFSKVGGGFSREHSPPAAAGRGTGSDTAADSGNDSNPCSYCLLPLTARAMGVRIRGRQCHRCALPLSAQPENPAWCLCGVFTL